jgi:YVTN family beta-propeller protein
MRKLISKQWLVLFLAIAVIFNACEKDDDPITGFNAELSVTTEGNEADLVSIVYTVTLSQSNQTGSDIIFDFNTNGGTATPGEDYTAITDANANLTIANGSSTGTITVEVLQDTEYEETETVIGEITNVSYSELTILTAQATANIVDNDDGYIYANGVLISNEGTFGSGNGSISYYSYSFDEVTNDVFKTVNGRSLGDVLQSITVHNDLAYMVMNGSNKVEVAYANNMVQKGVITGVTSPRYFIGVSDTKGYISEWGNGSETNIQVVDLTTLAITKSITVGAGPERMLLHNNKVYVANSGGYVNASTVSVIDPSTDGVIKTIDLGGDSPRDFIVDANDDIWVLCAGYIDYSNYPTITETASKLVRIDPTTNTVAQTITIGESYHPTCLETSKNGNNIFYGGGYGVVGIYKMAITDSSVPTTALLDKTFYGFNINPETGNIFALEAPNFTANGTLRRYKGDGTELGSYEVGIGPNGTNSKKK